MALIDEVLGVLLIGAYINCALYALELVCLYFYFTKHASDHVFLKGVITLMALVDTANTMLQCATVYSQAVTHFGDAENLAKGTVFFSLQVILPSTTALICQLFLVWRFWKVSKNYILSAFLCLAPFRAYASAIYATVALVVYTSLADRVKVTQVGTSWLVCEAVGDIIIAIALVLLLARYTRKTTFVETQSMLKKLMFNAIQTGSVTAIVATAMLLAFLLSKTTNINTGFSYVLGRVYALTLLVNLLARPTSDSSSNGMLTNQLTSHGGGAKSQNVAGTRFGIGTFRVGGERGNTVTQTGRHGGVDVNHEVTVHIDHELGSADEKADFNRLGRGDSTGSHGEDGYELSKLSQPKGGAAF